MRKVLSRKAASFGRSSCRAGRRHGGTEGCGPPSVLPQPGLARPTHLVDKAVVHELSGKVLGAVGCDKGAGRGMGGRGMRPRCGPGQPPPRGPTQGPPAYLGGGHK